MRLGLLCGTMPHKLPSAPEWGHPDPPEIPLTGLLFLPSHTPVYLYLPCCRRNEELIKKLQVPAEGSQPLQFSSKYPQGYLTQFYMVFWKFWQSYW